MREIFLWRGSQGFLIGGFSVRNGWVWGKPTPTWQRWQSSHPCAKGTPGEEEEGEWGGHRGTTEGLDLTL